MRAMTAATPPSPHPLDALKGFGLPEGFATVLANVDAHVQNGALEDHSLSLSRLIGRPTTPIGQTITAVL